MTGVQTCALPISYLTDQVRTQASAALPGERFLVMTRESIVALLPPGKTLADCAKQQCEVEVGRTIGADYIVTGEVLKFGESLRLNIKVHHCVSGQFLGSETAKGAKVDDLESGLAAPAGALFAKVRMHAGVGLAGAGSTGGGADGQYGSAPEAWSPNARKKVLVKFTSEPPGAMVLADGSVLCQSTPCSKLVPSGTLQVQMQRERYAPRTEAVTIAADGASVVDWTLTPTFGWLTVRTVPESLSVTINGEAVRSPVVRREVDPGAYDVRLADPRYYEKGERATVATGAERTVTLAPVAREGAIEVTATDAKGNDVAGKLTVDGCAEGEVPGTVKLMVGKHKLAVAGGASGSWRGEVTVTERTVTPVVAKLVKGAAAGDESYELLADGEIVQRGDLMWTVRDNGSDVDWNEAKAYCEACRVGGYSDWRMPTIEELQGLYVKGNSYKTRDVSGDYPAHIAKPFILTTPWVWSSTLDGSSSAFYFFFGGVRGSNGLTVRGDYRVLCVRRSGE